MAKFALVSQTSSPLRTRADETLCFSAAAFAADIVNSWIKPHAAEEHKRALNRLTQLQILQIRKQGQDRIFFALNASFRAQLLTAVHAGGVGVQPDVIPPEVVEAVPAPEGVYHCA